MIKAEFGTGEKRPKEFVQAALGVAQPRTEKLQGVPPFFAIRLPAKSPGEACSIRSRTRGNFTIHPWCCRDGCPSN